MTVKLLAFGIALFLAPVGTGLQGSSGEDGIYDLHPVLDAKNKVRIPANLTEGLADLRQMLDPRLVEKMRTGTEDDMVSFHHGLGTWLRNNWGLWGGSRLARYFNGLGIFHPDDMSGILLDSFWRELNAKPIDLEGQVAYYREYWRQNSIPEKLRCPDHRSRLEHYMSMPGPRSVEGSRTLHALQCRKRHETWVWEVDRGLYKPDDELLKAINDE